MARSIICTIDYMAADHRKSCGSGDRRDKPFESVSGNLTTKEGRSMHLCDLSALCRAPLAVCCLAIGRWRIRAGTFCHSVSGRSRCSDLPKTAHTTGSHDSSCGEMCIAVDATMRQIRWTGSGWCSEQRPQGEGREKRANRRTAFTGPTRCRQDGPSQLDSSFVWVQSRYTRLTRRALGLGADTAAPRRNTGKNQCRERVPSWPEL
jgi:hypothetical protein